MRHVAATAGIQDGVVVLEAMGDIVGTEDRDLASFGQAWAAHQGDIGP